jgi:hypothetical protein
VHPATARSILASSSSVTSPSTISRSADDVASGDRVGVARHDADAHAAVDERGDEAPPDAPGAADDEDDLVGF